GQFDKEAMAIDPYSGIIYVTYTRFGGTNGIWAARSLDGGLSFETPRPVADNPPVQLQGSFPVVGAYGELYVAYNLGYPGNHGVGLAASSDNGYTFSGFRQIASLTNFTVPGSDRAPAFPQMAADTSGGPNHGNLYIVYQSQNPGTNGDIMFMASRDGGAT